MNFSAPRITFIIASRSCVRPMGFIFGGEFYKKKLTQKCKSFKKAIRAVYLTEKYVLNLYSSLNSILSGEVELYLVLSSNGQEGGIRASSLPINQYKLNIFETSFTKHEQFVISAPISFTCVNDRQSILALPMYMCWPSTSHSFVCNTPPPMRRGKFTERTIAALRLTKMSVSKFGFSLVGALCAIRILMPRCVPAVNIDWKIFSPLPTTIKVYINKNE